MSFIGDLGGVFDLAMTLIGIFIFPISQHSFTLKALSKMYLARTNHNNLFKSIKNKRAKNKN